MKYIGFKKDVSYNDFINLTPAMGLVANFVAWYIAVIFKKDAIITSIKNDRSINKSSVHHYYRGVDWRVHHLTSAEKKQLEKAINEKFHYGRGYKTAMIYGNGGNEHLHTQVPNETDLRFVLL